MSNQEKDIDVLLSNPQFKSWVLDPNLELNLFWENWLKQNTEKREAVKKARIIIKALQFDENKLAEEDRSKLWSRIKESNASLAKSDVRETKIRPINDKLSYNRKVETAKPVNYLLRYAAVLVGTLVLVLTATLVLEDFSANVEAQMIEKTNESGQKATIFLADGTLVTLNSSSKLIYPKNFAENERKVVLQGEAFFKVKEGSKPFVVETSNLTARVLGTSFNIRDFSGKNEHSIALVTGKVMVSAAKTPQEYVILSPGEMGSLDSLTGKLLTTHFDYDEEIAWKDGILVFKNLSYKNVLSRLTDWYGVNFILENHPKEDFLITGSFDNESLDHVLQSIGYIGEFTYSIDGNNVYLTFNPKNSL